MDKASWMPENKGAKTKDKQNPPVTDERPMSLKVLVIVNKLSILKSLLHILYLIYFQRTNLIPTPLWPQRNKQPKELRENLRLKKKKRRNNRKLQPKQRVSLRGLNDCSLFE